MQERNSKKVMLLMVKATKMTANVLKSAVKAYLSAQKNKSPNGQPCRTQVHSLLYRRVPSSSQRGADSGVFLRNLEAFQKMGRYSYWTYSECKGLACKP